MKTLLAISVCIGTMALLTAGCRKSATSVNNSIEGRWELKQIRANTTVNYPVPNGNEIRFTGSNYEFILGGDVVTSHGTFTIVNDSTVEHNSGIFVEPGTYTRRIIYDNKVDDPKKFIEISGNTLTFLTGNFSYDAGSFTVYTRIAN